MNEDEPLIAERAAERLMRVVQMIYSGTPYVEAGIYAVYSEGDNPRYLRQDEAFERFAHDLEAAIRGAVMGNRLFKEALAVSILRPAPIIIKDPMS